MWSHTNGLSNKAQAKKCIHFLWSTLTFLVFRVRCYQCFIKWDEYSTEQKQKKLRVYLYLVLYCADINIKIDFQTILNKNSDFLYEQGVLQQNAWLTQRSDPSLRQSGITRREKNSRQHKYIQTVAISPFMHETNNPPDLCVGHPVCWKVYDFSTYMKNWNLLSHSPTSTLNCCRAPIDTCLTSDSNSSWSREVDRCLQADMHAVWATLP